MADRVRPNAIPVSANSQTTSPEQPPKTAPPPPAGTYIIQVPKEQVYRYPPPENARRYANYTRQKKSRCCSRCCCCLCGLIILFITLIVLFILAAVTFLFIIRPQEPNYTLDSIAVNGMNFTSSLALSTISPEFNLTVNADNNGNKKIGIYYEKDSTVEIFYRDVRLCKGALPVFYQPSNNVTVFQTVLRGSGVELGRSDRRALVKAVAKRSVPLSLKVIAPFKIKVGSVKTWKIIVQVDCDVTVDELTAQAKIIHKNCHLGWRLWL